MSKLISTLAIGSIVFSAIALTPTMYAAPKNDADRSEMRALKMEKAKLYSKERLLKLKTALELKDNQMAAWDKYSKTMMANADKNMQMMSDKMQMRAESKTKPTSLELAQGNITRLEHKLSEAKARLTAFSALYNVLDDNQKEKVDSLARRKIHREAKALRKSKMMMHKNMMKHQKMKKEKQ